MLNMEERKSFHVVDFVIFGATIIASVVIGLFFVVRKKKTFSSADYFFGGKKLRSLPVALSFVVTFQSSLLVLGVPAETYGYGIKFSLQVVGIMISFILGAFIAVPVFRPLKLTSIYKYFNLRYGSNEVRFIAATGGIIYLLFYMAVVVLGASVALNSVLRIPFWATVLTYTTVTTIYTSLGGFKAVIWTDVFQLVIMGSGILATLIQSTKEAGGPSEIYNIAKARFDVADFRFDPTIRYTVWTLLFGPITQYLVMFFTQAGLQRIKSTSTTKSAYTIFIVSAPIYCLFAILCSFEGVVLFAYYSSTGCDPLASGRINNINEILPTAVMDLFGTMTGFPGLYIASLSSAALSTLSSCLTGLSCITFEDIIKIKFPDINDKKATMWSKMAVFVYGALSMGLCFLMSLLTGPVTAIFQAFMGSIDGPTCGIFILSIFFLRSTTKGIITGALTGMLVSMALNLGQTFVPVSSNTYLSLGPTNGCFVPILNVTTPINITSELSGDEYLLSSTVTSVAQNLTTYSAIGIATDDTTFLQNLFGISFMLFSLIGFLVTVFVGIVASILTKKTSRENIDMLTLYPLPDTYCSLFPNGFFYSKSEEEERKLLNEETKPVMQKQKRTYLYDSKTNIDSFCRQEVSVQQPNQPHNT